MPGTFSPAADFKGNRWLAIPACITARAWRTCRDACRDRLPAVTGKTFPAFQAHAHPQICVSGKRPIMQTDSWEKALRWMPQNLFDNDKSTLVQVMAWCRQATSHYLSQCEPRSCPHMALLGRNELIEYKSCREHHRWEGSVGFCFWRPLARFRKPP